MPERGVLYIVWGDQIDPTLERSRRSLAQHHPDLPVEIVRVPPENGPSKSKALIAKARMMSLSPFRETLFLDADTVVLGNLDFGFEKAARFGLACAICECPWARRYRNAVKGDTVEYNTGVLFFTEKAKPLFDTWERLAPALDSSMAHVVENQLLQMHYNDQCAFAMAVEETAFVPFVLPLNWNYRPRWQPAFFGPIKIWHDYADPPASLRKTAEYYERPGSVVQFHSFK